MKSGLALTALLIGLTASSCDTNVIVDVPCLPSNCQGCCLADGRCQLGAISAECGSNGAACVACSDGLVCQRGACQVSAPGGGSAGGGSAGGGSAGGGSAGGGSAGGGSAGGGSAGGGSAGGGSAGGGSAGGGSAGGGSAGGGSAGGGSATCTASGCPVCGAPVNGCTTFDDETSAGSVVEIYVFMANVYYANPSCIRVKKSQSVKFTVESTRTMTQSCGPVISTQLLSGMGSKTVNFSTPGVYGFQMAGNSFLYESARGAIMVVP